MNFYLFMQEEKMNKKRYRMRHPVAKGDERR